MNCPKCGSPVGKNDEYCGSCGYHLNTSGEPEQKKKKPGLLIFTVVLEVIAIVAIVGAILFVVHGDKETEKDSGEVKIEETDLNHNIVIVNKIKECPPNYPRKAGIVNKKPIK